MSEGAPRDIHRQSHSYESGACGMCVYPSDIGLDGYDHKGPAYVNPTCSEHGDDPQHTYEEASTQHLHAGIMGVCKCGAYRDEHDREAQLER